MTNAPVPELIHAASWLHEMPAWLVILGLIAAMMISASIGFASGRRRHTQTGDTGRGHFNAVQASLLALLALLLSFTINMANQRYEARRQLVVEDANNLAALHLRGTYLPEPQRAEFTHLLRDYVGTRADAQALKLGVNRKELSARLTQAADLHARMCELVRAEIQREGAAKGTEAMVPLLIDAQGILRRRIYAFQSRVPDPILILLLSAAVAAAGVVGYSGGLGQHRGTVQSVFLALFVSGTLYVILDLDHPLHGIMEVDQTPMLQLKEYLDQEVSRTQ
jgi:hypothetical protein